MSISVLLPILYLGIGVLATRLSFDAKPIAAAVLSRFIIPAVVAYNIATSPPGFFVVIGGIMLAMLLGLLLSERVTSNKVASLCFYYLNIGWLGLPVAASAFGDEAARFFVAAYIGGSIFGNAVASSQLGDESGYATRAWRTAVSPTALGLYAGLACRPFAGLLTAHLAELYGVLKWSVSFLGMAILGMWLPSRPLRRAELAGAGRIYLAKTGFWALVGLASVLVAKAFDFSFVSDNASAIGLMALLPPAANIIVIETHYGGSGESSPMIVWGTLISIAAIVAYIGAFMLVRSGWIVPLVSPAAI